MEIKRFFGPLIIFFITVIFFYKSFLFFQVPFPGDLLISEYAPWKYERYLGYNPGSYPNKAQYFDVIRQLYPWKILAIDEIKKGRFPLWNPYNFSGSPLLANNQSSVFNPFNLFFFAFNSSIAWSVFIIVQPFLATLFMYLYLRQIKLVKEASLLGGVAYGFSLFMSTFLEYGNFGHTIMWLPCALFLIEKINRDKKGISIYLLPIIIATIIFSGHLQLAFGCILFILPYVIFLTRKRIVIVLLIALGIGISAIQLLPTLELIGYSARVPHELGIITNNFLLQFHQLMLFISPDTYGNPVTRNYLLGDTYPGNAVYIGVVPMLFGLYAVTQFKKNLYVKYFVIVGLFLFLLFINNPISTFFYSLKLPFLSSSSPSNFFFLLIFALSTLGAFGLASWDEKRDKTIFIVLASLFLLTVVFIVTHQFFHFPFYVKQSLVGLGLLIFVGFIIFLQRLFGKKVILYVFILITSLELFYYFQKFNPFVSSKLMYPSTKIEAEMKNLTGFDRYIGYKAATIESNFSTQFRMYSPDGYDPLYPQTYNKYTNSSSRSDAVVGIHDNQQVDELGVKYVLDRKENGSDQTIFLPGKFVKKFELNDWIVFENKSVFPRAYIVSGKERSAAVIEKYLPTRVEIKKPEIAGTLVLTDNFFPGWKAFVDGKERPILKIDEVFRGVEVRKNDKIIVFEYKPAVFYIGMVLTIISIGILGIYYLIVNYIWKK